MKKKNAFTLIELLAVIVVLAIIALIATPIILGIIEDAKKDAFLRSVEMLVSTTDLDINTKTYEEEYTYTITDGNISNLDIPIKNTKGMNGNITYDKEGQETYAVYNGKYCVVKAKESNAEISDYVEGDCVVPTDISCFTYNPIYNVTKILDVDKCVEYMSSSKSREDAIKICNNEPYYYSDTGAGDSNLIDYLNEVKSTDSLIIDLIEGGIVAGKETKYLEISNYENNCPKDVIVPKTIDGKIVTSIGYSAFRGESLTSFQLPSTIEKIMDNAFSENNFVGELDLSMYPNLKYVNGFDSNEITSIKLPTSIEVIGYQAFAENQFRGELDLSMYPNLKVIGDQAFPTWNSEYQITSIKFPNSIQSIGEWAFSGSNLSGELDLSMYPNLTHVNGFDDCGITSVKLPINIEEIGSCAFESNEFTGELDLSMYTNLKEIYGFAGNKITSFKLPSSVEKLDAFGYNQLSGEFDLSIYPNLKEVGGLKNNTITNIIFPSNIERLYSWGFADNQISGELDLSMYSNLKYVDGFDGNSITSVKLPSVIKELGATSFRHNQISGELDLSMYSDLTVVNGFGWNEITSVVLPNSVEIIGSSAFNKTKLSGELNLSMYPNLKEVNGFSDNAIISVKFPNSIEKIDYRAFQYNQLSGELDLSNTKVYFISYGAFVNNKISSIKFPGTIQAIGDFCFKNNQLTSVTFYGRTNLTGVRISYDTFGWAEGYNAENNIYFVNE